MMFLSGVPVITFFPQMRFHFGFQFLITGNSIAILLHVCLYELVFISICSQPCLVFPLIDSWFLDLIMKISLTLTIVVLNYRFIWIILKTCSNRLLSPLPRVSDLVGLG